MPAKSLYYRRSDTITLQEEAMKRAASARELEIDLEGFAVILMTVHCVPAGSEGIDSRIAVQVRPHGMPRRRVDSPGNSSFRGSEECREQKLCCCQCALCHHLLLVCYILILVLIFCASALLIDVMSTSGSH